MTDGGNMSCFISNGTHRPSLSAVWARFHGQDVGLAVLSIADNGRYGKGVDSAGRLLGGC